MITLPTRQLIIDDPTLGTLAMPLGQPRHNTTLFLNQVLSLDFQSEFFTEKVVAKGCVNVRMTGECQRPPATTGRARVEYVIYSLESRKAEQIAKKRLTSH